MKKTWEAPELEVLDVKMTLAGPGRSIPDAVQPDEDETVNHS
ncbi:paeninodin family lasso peptide [Paenibacillus medicaginis]|uniref:Paeninodin family lasso peptide n=1 Tax=Paenibacillus medicaginis TaxID=1470560 RepID=A0ABV5BY75_9BACL